MSWGVAEIATKHLVTDHDFDLKGAVIHSRELGRGYRICVIEDEKVRWPMTDREARAISDAAVALWREGNERTEA